MQEWDHMAKAGRNLLWNSDSPATSRWSSSLPDKYPINPQDDPTPVPRKLNIMKSWLSLVFYLSLIFSQVAHGATEELFWITSGFNVYRIPQHLSSWKSSQDPKRVTFVGIKERFRSFSLIPELTQTLFYYIPLSCPNSKWEREKIEIS